MGDDKVVIPLKIPIFRKSYFHFNINAGGYFAMHALVFFRPRGHQIWVAHGRWFSPASLSTKTGRHDIAESGAKHQTFNQS
jgi:hypothetical protein